VGITGDETWVSFVNAETKEQWKHWMMSARWLTATVFWDTKECWWWNSCKESSTVTSQVYLKTLKNCVGPWECWHPV
jgi:hypothetical protein